MKTITTCMLPVFLILSIGIGGCCSSSDGPASKDPAQLMGQPPVRIVAADKAAISIPAQGKRRLWAYVSPSRGMALAVAEAVEEVKRHRSWTNEMDLYVQNERLLEAAVTSFTHPAEGDSRYWNDAVCDSGVWTCEQGCVSVGNDLFRHATTLNTSGCVSAPGSRCWDGFGRRCEVRYYTDINCAQEVPNTQTFYYDWICQGQ